MKKFSHDLRGFCKARPGLIILLIILGIISFSSIKPDFYLLGWDNFSSYFNLKTNIFNTFFATWREYRGLGVPSDSESTDLFRQLFYLSLKPLMKESLLDQAYTLAALCLGVISMYILANLFYRKYFSVEPNKQNVDIFASLTAFFYLFNLNTLSTFYFPMIMYVNRFFAIPLVFLAFFLFINHKTISKKMYLIICFLLLFASGAYLTATVLIIIVLGIIIFGVFQSDLKRFLLVLVFYLLLQSFWLLPLVNYTIQKGSIMRLAPNFINANESQLNKPKSFYSLEKQLSFYPNFFDTDFFNIEGSKKLRFHELSQSDNQPFYRVAIGIFPILYVAGAILIIRKRKTISGFIFIPLTIFLFLFLSLKEFSPIGFLYSFFNSITPYFGVLFRFGDTKFHPLIAFAGSFSASFALMFLGRSIRRLLSYIIFLLIIAVFLFVFKSYLNGSLISSYKYNVLPSAYSDMAAIINKDKDYFRVLQLPFSKEDYWKSYSWGLFGSAFINFMIDHPFIDKTFEPASMENAYLDKKINDLLSNIQMIRGGEEKAERTRELAEVLRRVGVKYVIFDDSVATALYPRRIQLWGKFNNADTKVMIDSMEELGLAKTVKSYDIDLKNYLTTFAFWHELTESEKELLINYPVKKIRLIKINGFAPLVKFLPNISNVDPQLANLLELNLLKMDNHLIQNPNLSFTIFPFAQRNLDLELSDNEYRLNLGKPLVNNGIATSVASGDFLAMTGTKNGQVFLKVPEVIPMENKTQLIDVYAQKDAENLTISFFVRQTPTINGRAATLRIKDFTMPLDLLKEGRVYSDLHSYISDWSSLGYKQVGSLRLRIGDYILPLPSIFSQDNSYLATVAVRGVTIPLEILSFDTREYMDLSDFSPTENPNCFFDKLKDSSYNFIRKDIAIAIASQNQSACVFADLKPLLGSDTAHVEIRLNMDGQALDLEEKFGLSFDNTAKPNLKKFVHTLAKPNLVRVCAKETMLDNCYNSHQFINVQGETEAVFPLEKPLEGGTDMGIFLSLKNTGYQKQDIEFKKISIDKYMAVARSTLSLPYITALSVPVELDKNSVVLGIPKALSNYSFSINPKREGLYGYNPQCEKKEGYRTFRLFEDYLLTYLDNCYFEVFHDANFSSDNFYLWLMSYNLLSGKYPRLVLEDKFYSYVDQYASFYQGYPDIKSFKKFQLPEMWYDAFSSNEDIQKTLSGVSFQNTYVLVDPQPEVWDAGKKQFLLHQDSENEGIILLKNFSLQVLPSAWQSLTLEGAGGEQAFAMPKQYTVKRLLPSLAKVKLDRSRNKFGMTSSKSGMTESYLMLFNEGFDKQWKVYHSLWGVALGLGQEIGPYRCDGYANCFYLDSQDTVKNDHIYIFYTPERLNILGWIITIGTVIFFLRVLAKPKT